MKLATLLYVLPLLVFSLVGCDQKTVKNSGNSSNNYCIQNPYAQGCSVGTTAGNTSGTNYCTLYPTAYGCPGYQGGVAGGTTGTTANCTTHAYMPNCPNYTNNYYSCFYNPSQSFCTGFCSNYPTTPYCANGGGTTGGTTGVNPGTWGALYPQGVPTDTCIAAQDPYPNDGITAWNTRTAFMAIVGKGLTSSDPDIPMDPSSSSASGYFNTSAELMSTTAASNFISGGTDSQVKIRVKVKPQPNSANATYCAGRSGSQSTAGYTKLAYTIQVAPKSNPSARSTIYSLTDSSAQGINTCSNAIDLSYYKALYGEFFVIISNVQSNQHCSFTAGELQTNGFKNCSIFKPVRKADCWSMELEVSYDGSKQFP